MKHAVRESVGRDEKDGLQEKINMRRRAGVEALDVRAYPKRNNHEGQSILKESVDSISFEEVSTSKYRAVRLKPRGVSDREYLVTTRRNCPQ